MATLKIKRTTGDTKPSTVEPGELIYAYDTTSNGGTYSRRLFIGDPTTNTNSPKIVGGEFFTEMLDHTKGTLTANSAVIVDANSKIDVLNVDNLTLNGNAITSTNTNGDITITPNGTGYIVLDGQNWPQADGSADSFLTTNGAGQLSWASVPSGSFTIADNQSPANTDTFTTGQTLTFTGSTDITTTVSDNNITIAYSGDAPAIIDNLGTPAFATGITKAEVLTILNVEDGADVTDTANVTAAGALMDSEVDADIKTLSLPANTTISAFGASLVDDADATAARTTLGVDAAGTDNSTNVTLVTTAADYLSIVGQAITLGLIDLANDVTGSLPNGNLANSSITIGNNTIALGGTDTDITGLTSLVVDNISVDGSTVTTSTGGLTLDSAGGTVTVSDNLSVSGNLTVNGTTTTVNSTTVTIDDPIFTLGGDTAPASDDNKDRGIEFRWHNGLAAKVGFFGFDDSTGKFTFIPDATNTSEVFSGTAGTIVANLEGAVTGDVTGTVSSLSNHDTDDLSEGVTNLYYTDARAQAAITGGVGIDNTSGTLSLNLNELTDTGIAVAADSIAFIDATDNGSKKETIADFVAAIAGTNISATNGVMSVATATTSTIGLASFSSTEFTVTAGAVSLNTVDGGTYP